MTLLESATPLEGSRAHAFQRASLRRLRLSLLLLLGACLAIALATYLFTLAQANVGVGTWQAALSGIHHGIMVGLGWEDVVSRHYVVPIVAWTLYLYGFVHMVRASNKAAALYYEPTITKAQAKWLRPRVNRFNRYWLLGDIVLFFCALGGMATGFVKAVLLAPPDLALTLQTVVLCITGALLRTTSLHRFFLHPEVMSLISVDSRNISGQNVWSASRVASDEVFFTIGTTVLRKHGKD